MTTHSLFAPQVKVLELESHLENERLRLGELRKKHYELAGVPLEPEGNGVRSPSPAPAGTMSPKPSKPALMKKPALAQKPTIPSKSMVRMVTKRQRVVYDKVRSNLLVNLLFICLCCSLNDAWAAEETAPLTDGWTRERSPFHKHNVPFEFYADNPLPQSACHCFPFLISFLFVCFSFLPKWTRSLIFDPWCL